jgi:hypothetical protein
MTRGQLVTRVQIKLGMTDDAEALAFLQDVANEGVVDLLIKTHCYIERGDMTLTVNVSEYRLDSVILAIDNGRVTTASGTAPYELISQDEMIDYQSSSPVGSGVNKYVSIMGDLMTVAPTPGSSGEIIRFWHVPRPTLMTLDSHDPSNPTYGGIPTEYHRAIEYYMLWQGAEYDDKVTALDAQKYQAAYESECQNVRKRLRRKAGRGLRGGRVGYPPRFRTGRNDTYPEH